MRRIHLHSPKLGRALVLFSYQSLKLWALIESHPSIVTFCEYPGYVIAGGQRVLADFWIQRGAEQEFLALDKGLELALEQPRKAPTFANARLRRVADAEVRSYQAWIDSPSLGLSRIQFPPCSLDQTGHLRRKKNHVSQLLKIGAGYG
jgi:hypothetical protein